jgi:hypothetical protein
MGEDVIAKHGLKHAAASPLLGLLERLGYAARGTLYVVMGFLALLVALHIGGGQTTDLPGSLVFLVRHPFGKLVVVVIALGLSAYSLWGFVRAIYDPLHRGRSASGYAERFGFLTSAVSYATIVFLSFQLLLGASGNTAGDSTQNMVAHILTYPLGGLAAVLAGLFSLAVGFGQFFEAIHAAFARDLKGAEMTTWERDGAILLGRVGMFARGIAFLIIGWFIIQAGLHHAAAQAQGFGGAFLFLLAQPYGRWLLGIIALGFIALGLHSFVCARWVRLMNART